MKQKTISPLTKHDLEDIFDKKLKNYPTKIELEKSFKNSESRLENKLEKKFTKRFLESQRAFRNEIDHKFSSMEERFLSHLSKFTDKILTIIDPLVNELETRQLDREIASDQMLKVRDEIDDHEKRIKKLEQS